MQGHPTNTKQRKKTKQKQNRTHTNKNKHKTRHNPKTAWPVISWSVHSHLKRIRRDDKPCRAFNILTPKKCASRHNGVHFFRHLNFPKVVRTWCVLCILTSNVPRATTASTFFDITISKKWIEPVCFVHFDLEMQSTTASLALGEICVSSLLSALCLSFFVFLHGSASFFEAKVSYFLHTILPLLTVRTKPWSEIGRNRGKKSKSCVVEMHILRSRCAYLPKQKTQKTTPNQINTAETKTRPESNGLNKNDHRTQ